MSKYILAKSARVDLIEIWTYLADKNLDAADEISNELHSAFDLLALSPRLGHVREDLTKNNVRFWPVRDYLVIYQDSSPLEIVRVLSGFRDITDLLKGAAF